MIGKIHSIQGRTILAVCDKEHLGKEFEDGKIAFKASEKFYGTDTITKEEIIENLKNVNSINLFGNKCIEMLEREGLIKENNVILIKGIKHAQLYQL
jgi:uncharacterized protein